MRGLHSRGGDRGTGGAEGPAGDTGGRGGGVGAGALRPLLGLTSQTQDASVSWRISRRYQAGARACTYLFITSAVDSKLGGKDTSFANLL